MQIIRPFQRNLNDARFARYPLWIADYDVLTPDIAEPWQKNGWHFWQHTSTGQIPGIATSFDLNRFRGSVAELEDFIKSTVSGK